MSNALEGEPQGLAVISELRAAITRLEESDTRKIARIAEQSARIAELEAALGVRTVNPLDMSKAESVGEPEQMLTKGQVVALVNGTVSSRRHKAPFNFHQFVSFALSRPAGGEDVDLRRWAPGLFLLSALMVFAQCAAAMGVLWGTGGRSCKTNDDCDKLGQFCFVGSRDRCQDCGQRVPILMETDGVTLQTYNFPEDDRFVGFNHTAVAEACSNPVARRGTGGELPFTAAGVVSWCDACVHAETGSVDPMNSKIRMESTIGSMGVLDWLSLGFASTVIALSCVAEIQDIQLVAIASTHARAGDNLTPGWCRALAAVGGVRHWLLLPLVTLTSFGLVVNEGGDAKSVVLNTISVLFVLEFDDIVFSIGLPNRWRERMEYVGRVDLNADEAEHLTRTKFVHTVLLSLAIPATTLMAAADLMGNPWNGLPMLLVWWLGGMLVIEMTSCNSVLANVAQITGSTLLGYVGMLVLLVIGGIGQAR